MRQRQLLSPKYGNRKWHLIEPCCKVLQLTSACPAIASRGSWSDVSAELFKSELKIHWLFQKMSPLNVLMCTGFIRCTGLVCTVCRHVFYVIVLYICSRRVCLLAVLQPKTEILMRTFIKLHLWNLVTFLTCLQKANKSLPKEFCLQSRSPSPFSLRIPIELCSAHVQLFISLCQEFSLASTCQYPPQIGRQAHIWHMVQSSAAFPCLSVGPFAFAPSSVTQTASNIYI